MSADWTLCIDFGTAYSKAAAAPADSWRRFDPGLLRPLMLGGEGANRNAFLLESAVFVDDDRILFGSGAVARAAIDPASKRDALRSFKTLLSVSDLDRALNTGLPLSIDPHRQFSMGDLILLYLGYLTASIDRAIAADPTLSAVTHFERRYAAPAWRAGDSAGLHSIVTRLFGQAETLRDALGDVLLSPPGVLLGDARKALDRAYASKHLADMGLIYEATAAAAYSSIGLEVDAPALLIVDMGAGTTDIAVLARAGARVEELGEARVTLKQAGDYIDRVLANLILARNRRVKTAAAQGVLWREAIAGMREFKESLFAEGRAGLRHNGRLTVISLKDLERAKDFRAFRETLEDAYQHGVDVARKYAALHGRHEVQTVAVGGGAAAPFIQALIRQKPRRNAGKLQIVPRPPTPEWVHAEEFRGNLAPVFPQLAIAIGGALAPEEMLASAVSSAADGRSGNLAVRD
jgi:molecular chaperone DnaK (HSP70)